MKESFDRVKFPILEDNSIAVREFDLIKAIVIYHYKLDEIYPQIINHKRSDVIKWIQIIDLENKVSYRFILLIY